MKFRTTYKEKKEFDDKTREYGWKENITSVGVGGSWRWRESKKKEIKSK